MEGKIMVRRANVVLEIPETSKDEYMKNGYSVIDPNTGAIIEQAMSTDVKTLQCEIARLQKENEELKAKLNAKAEKPAKVEKPKAPAKKTKE